jgi:homoserine dehydrogenase
VLGAGTVGSALIGRLIDDRSIGSGSGLDLAVRRIAVKHISKKRPFDLPGLVTDQAEWVVNDPSIDVVVEAIGGVEPAGDLLLAAIEAGKPVITANKELVATRGAEILEASRWSGVPFLYEAAVGGGIPIIRALVESLSSEKITRLVGVLNGTTNYILSAMTAQGTSFRSALEKATELGYAEPDPSDDISGRDTAFKISILARVAMGARVPPWEVATDGISGLTETDIEQASAEDRVWKLIGRAEQTDESVTVSVRPELLDREHPLAAIGGVTNAVMVEGPAIGQLIFSGPGAGGEATATALIGDLVQAMSRPRVRPGARRRPPRILLHR